MINSINIMQVDVKENRVMAFYQTEMSGAKRLLFKTDEPSKFKPGSEDDQARDIIMGTIKSKNKRTTDFVEKRSELIGEIEADEDGDDQQDQMFEDELYINSLLD